MSRVRKHDISNPGAKIKLTNRRCGECDNCQQPASFAKTNLVLVGQEGSSNHVLRGSV